ncbi:LysE family translocator [Roseibium sediminicola]|uniref:LysE family translocator n=1 Tax=Roseibium sediminicola TaxID=2933272 RepID=A0ABT0H453_9HYPH|nr:LysE family translocator [Roseibium sp. CAU 1639]MCK7616092.1 LysE family translocator [Roseibium sp. CAU 1639]
MPDFETLVLFTIAAIALVVVPGPNMLLIATRSATRGAFAGMATYVGIATGSYLHATFLALGLSQIFLAIPMAYDAVRIAGAIYLLCLAWQSFTSVPSGQNQLQDRHKANAWTMFRQGLLTNFLNPKVALFFLALFPQFLDPNQGSVALQILVLAMILNLSALLIYGGMIVVVAKSRSAVAQNPTTRRIGQYFTGLVFCGLAVRLALDDRH